MKYSYNEEEVLSQAKEMVSEAAELLEEVLPETAEELGWIRENIREEILSVRTARCMAADGAAEENPFDF